MKKTNEYKMTLWLDRELGKNEIVTDGFLKDLKTVIPRGSKLSFDSAGTLFVNTPVMTDELFDSCEDDVRDLENEYGFRRGQLVIGIIKVNTEEN